MLKTAGIFLTNIYKLLLVAIFLIPLERIGSFSFGGATIRLSQILVLLVFLCYVLYSFLVKKVLLFFSAPLVFYVLFICSCLLSLVFANDKMRGLVIIGFLVFMFLVPYVMIALIRTKERLKSVIYILFISAFIACLFGLFQFVGDMVGLPSSITGLAERYTKLVLGFPRIQSTFIEPLYFANYLIVPLVVSLFFLIKKVDVKRKNIFAVLFLLFLVVILLTVSKGAILAIGVIFAGILLFQIRTVFSRSNLPYLLAIIIFLSLISWAAFFTVSSRPDFEKYYKKAYDVVFVGGSITERREAYIVAYDAYDSSSLIGIGTGGFGPYFSGYPANPPSYGWPIVNNEYLEILAEEGMVGLVTFGLFLFSIFYFSVVAYRKTNDYFLKNVLVALNLAFLGILVQYLTFSTLYIMHVWFLIGLILVSQKLVYEEDSRGKNHKTIDN